MNLDVTFEETNQEMDADFGEIQVVGAPGGDIPSALPNPHKLNFTGAVNAEYDGSKEVSVEIPAGGGGGWRLVNSITTTQDALSRVNCTKDSDGNPLSLTEAYIKVMFPASETLSGACFLYINNQHYSGPVTSNQPYRLSVYVNGITGQVSFAGAKQGNNIATAQWYLQIHTGFDKPPYITSVSIAGQAGMALIPIGATLEVYGR